MQETLKEQLKAAHGISQFVVAIFVDVRGFSSFAKLAESSEAAVFLRKTYIQILDEYFPQATFFKPTGDGLLLIIPYDEGSLDTTAREAVQSSMQLVTEFPSFLDNDPMINFEIPQYLGIGIARGAVTGLVSGETVLDYSGRPLNLAARLMDLARPQGVILDGSYGRQQIPEDLREQFASRLIYIRGIAERTPTEVLVTKGWTIIPRRYTQPLERTRWNTEHEQTIRLRDLARRNQFYYPLERKPLDATAIQLFVEYPDALPDGKQNPDMVSFRVFPARYEEQAGEPQAVVDFRPIVQSLRKDDVQDDWKIDLKLQYPLA